MDFQLSSRKWVVKSQGQGNRSALNTDGRKIAGRDKQDKIWEVIFTLMVTKDYFPPPKKTLQL